MPQSGHQHNIAINCDGFILQGLDDEVRDNPSIVRMHIRAIGVENSCHLDAQIVLPPVVEEECLGAAFSFIIARPEADGIDSSSTVRKI